MDDKLKLNDLLAEIALAKEDTEETILITASKMSKFPVAAKALKAAETIFGAEGVYAIEPGYKGNSARIASPKLGRTISGKVLLVSRVGQVVAPELKSLAIGGKEGALTIGDNSIKITAYLAENVPAATLDDVEDATSIIATLGLVGGRVDETTTGKVTHMQVMPIVEKDGTTKYRVFVECADGQYSFNSGTDVSGSISATVGQNIAKGFVGPLYVLGARHVDSIDTTASEFVAEVLRVEVSKMRNKKTGEFFDAYKLVTDKGVFMPNAAIRNSLKAIRPDAHMQLYKLQGSQIANVKCQELTDKFKDLI